MDVKNTHDGAFCRGVTPRFVVTGKDAKMATTNKLFVIETQDGII